MIVLDRVEGMEGREQGHPARRLHEASGATERKRSRAGRLALAALCVLLVGLLAFPRAARADGNVTGSVIWGPGDLPTGKRGVVVAASDKYVAAALALGYSASDISGWSDEVKAKLSNASTGGSFYEYVQTFHDWEDTHDDSGILGPFVEVLGSAFFSIVQSLYGDEIWLSSYDSGLGLNAAFDLALIVQGGDVGGGSSGNDGTGVFPLSWTDTGVTLSFRRQMTISGVTYYPNNYTYGGTTVTRSLPDSLTVTFSNQSVLTLLQDTTLKVYIFGTDAANSGGNASKNMKCLITDDMPVVTNYEQTYNGSTWHGQHYVWTKHDGKRYYYQSNVSVTESNGNFYTSTSVPEYTNFTTLSIDCPPTGNGANIFYYVGGASEPVVPPTNWPEVNAPSPPELPEPSNPTVDPADPWSVTIAPSLTFSVNLETDPVDTTSIVDWLKKIFYQLKLMSTDLRQWFENLHTDHSSIIRAINDSCSQLYVKWNEYEDNMMDEFDETRQYLYQLFHWLADQFDFQQDPFNDNNIVYWLKRIWSKLGNGDVNVRPTDPTVDPTGVFDWLNRLIEKLFDGLVDVANQLIDGAGDLLEAVIHQFPFSVPWDIAAYLTAFVAAPITPVFDIPIPAVQGWWDAFTIHVDMTPFDSTAATVRAMSKILFAGVLLMKSKELLEMMDVTRW